MHSLSAQKPKRLPRVGYLRSIPKQLSEPALVCCIIANLGAIFNHSSHIFIEEYEFEDVVSKMASISSRSQCVSLDMVNVYMWGRVVPIMPTGV